jgi:hypothetical protein
LRRLTSAYLGRCDGLRRSAFSRFRGRSTKSSFSSSRCRSRCSTAVRSPRHGGAQRQIDGRFAFAGRELLGCYGITDGSLSLQVKVPSGGSVFPNGGYRFLDVENPSGMKDVLDRVSLKNFVAAAEGALARSGATLADVGYLCGIHMKPSMHGALVEALGLDPARAAYLDDTGHMSGVDPLLALDRAARAGELREGELVLLLAAGTGYTWAASVVRWGECSR